MKVANATVLITGANRGLGLVFERARQIKRGLSAEPGVYLRDPSAGAPVAAAAAR